jgi:protein-tyrosine phosphatase
MADIADINITIENTGTKMIDWHTHILPFIDDGSSSIGESISMLKKSSEQGVTKIVLTPHYYPHKEDPERFLRRRDYSLGKLKSGIERIYLDEDNLEPLTFELPTLVLGAEVYFFSELAGMDESNLKALCIEGTNILMVELPMEEWGNNIFDALEGLIFNRNIYPLIAHIDRYFSFIKDSSPLKELVREGMLIQLNTEGLEGFFSKRKAVRWIEEGLVHILATDCHNQTDRPPNLAVAKTILKSHINERTIANITSFDPGLKDLDLNYNKLSKSL